jgi:prepilin-type N-terminal cleavage/methylation domain-containing protein
LPRELSHSAGARHLRHPRHRGGGAAGFSLVELLVVVAIASIMLLALSRFFVNYYAAYQETQYRLRLQRDMRTLAYWTRKDLTALAQRPGNFDLMNSAWDYAFMASDDPTDTQDFASNTGDDGMDRFSYTFSGNKVTRTWDPLGTMASVQNDMVLECIETGRGDTFAIEITLRDTNDSPLYRNQFDSTLGNFEVDSQVRRVDVQLIFSKRPWGAIFANRSAIVERAEIKSVAMYRRGG